MATASRQPDPEQPQPATPVFRRATREDALELAQTAFLNGDRVDMQQLATQLGVSRVTVFRWVGSREQLLEQILERLTVAFVADALANAEGEGEDRVLDGVRRMMTATVEVEPLRQFVTREPQIALRLLLAEQGLVHQRLADGLHAALNEAGLANDPDQLKSFVDVLVQVGTALQWATLSIGDEPQIERTVEIGRTLLRAAIQPDTSSTRRRRARQPRADR
jgi:AcrR family transcriptional regulator